MNNYTSHTFTLLIGLLIGIALTLQYQQSSTPQDAHHGMDDGHHESEDGHDTHLHAAFHLYENDKKVDFTDTKYMHVEPCTVGDEGADHSHDSLQDQIHLHDRNGEMIHIHHTDLTWGDFFESIDYEFDTQPTGYKKGEYIEDILEQEINNFDRVILFTGDLEATEEHHNALPTLEEIEIAAHSSEDCGS